MNPYLKSRTNKVKRKNLSWEKKVQEFYFFLYKFSFSNFEFKFAIKNSKLASICVENTQDRV